jgi:hypothetical protein
MSQLKVSNHPISKDFFFFLLSLRSNLISNFYQFMLCLAKKTRFKVQYQVSHLKHEKTKNHSQRQPRRTIKPSRINEIPLFAIEDNVKNL